MTAITDATYTEDATVGLVNVGGGLDYRLSSPANRYIKITYTTPGLQISDGDENFIYSYRLYNGTSVSDTLVQEWFVGIPSSDAITVSSAIVTDTSAANQTVLLSSSISSISTKKVGGGSYSVVVDSGASGFTSQNYTLFIGRSGGTASYNRLGTVPAQLIAEDCGSSV
jgi:hypothetical protein